MSKENKKSWIVILECTVIKDVIVEGCTEDEARENPFQYSVEESEIDMRDWEVKSIKPNE